jgi:TonB family protein
MSRTLFFAIALAVIASLPDLLAQGHVIMTPQLVDEMRRFTTYAPFPQYSVSARAHHLRGSGWFMLHVRSDGTVERVDVVQSTRHRELDDACISAYMQWRFRKDFAAKTHKVKIPVTFANP